MRKLPSGRWQARYTGPDGAMRTLGTFLTKTEADQELAHEVSRMARGVWHDPRLGDQPLGKSFRGRIATRGELAPNARLPERWIDSEVLAGSGGSRRRSVRLGAQTPADVREWDTAVLSEAPRRAGERSEGAATTTRVNVAIRAWADENGRPVASTARVPVALREAWVCCTDR